jgi:hypothetical protein
MADTLYLSLWYPNLRLDALPEKLLAVLGAFAAHGGEARVYSATVWPLNWSESPVFQQVYGKRGEQGAEPAFAVAEALELLHDDFAYEFQIGWSLLGAPPQGFVEWVPQVPRCWGPGWRTTNSTASERLASRWPHRRCAAGAGDGPLGRSLTRAPARPRGRFAWTSVRMRPFWKKIWSWTRTPRATWKRMCANWWS